MFVTSALALLSLAAALTGSGATSTNGTASQEQLDTVKAEFAGALIVPDLLQRFDPQGTLSVSFNGQPISTGQMLTQDVVAMAPSLEISPGNNSTELEGQNAYTIMMIDADVPGTNGNTTPLTRHWLVNSASLSTTNTPWALGYNTATNITDYAGPGPAAGSGPHRYCILVFYQPPSFAAPSNLSTAGTPLGTMLLNQYISGSGIGDVVAANYFQVENGQATVTYATTTPVNTATIDQQPSMTGSGSASGTTPSRAASSSGAAQPGREFGWGVTVGAMGVAGAVIGAGMGF